VDEKHDPLLLASVLHDRVTGLPAFALLVDELRAALEERRCLGVLHFELAGLDVVESLYGWQVFDRVVARAAGVLRDAVGRELPKGTLLGINAVAGERFAAFLGDDGRGGAVTAPMLARSARAAAERLDRELGLCQELAGLALPLEVRAGHALLSPDPFYRFERRVAAAIEHARAAPERRRKRRERSVASELERILREAAIRTLFQPVVDLRSHAVLGYEALARGPGGGPLEMPRALFLAGERLGVTLDLDRTCRDAALRAVGEAAIAPAETLFLNVVPQSFGSGSGDAARALDLLARVPGRVVVEFPERAADADPDGFLEAVRSARASGLGVALDDVGTGWSSQALVERVRPDFVKVDSSLVRGIERNLIKQEILRSVVRIANSLGASIVAEGIEARDEADVALAAGAQYGQGFLYARPASRTGEAGARP
jgi:EAL domain-containing protein (putative c-di-GMP-specific phosphodiesterase class I)/GGDEF domain-containing protein